MIMFVLDLLNDWFPKTMAGFDWLEIHNAHGYLIHQFLSPLSNTRDDGYGGDFEGRVRWPLELAAALRETWPADRPVSLRISAVDGDGLGWQITDSVEYARRLKEIGRYSRTRRRNSGSSSDRASSSSRSSSTCCPR